LAGTESRVHRVDENPVSDTLLVTGGAGFIGSNFIHYWIRAHPGRIVNLDKLTYAGNPRNLAALQGNPQLQFVRGDINDGALISKLIAEHRPRAILNFAAESHVDRSIRDPEAFVRTNIVGVYALLEQALSYWRSLAGTERDRFRFLQVSTDEVYGSLGPDDPAFREGDTYAPNSPYAASKASADHLVRAYHHTYGLPTLTTNCSNNYGPYQFPEKLIPLMILNAVRGKPLPVYGDGQNVRDWLYVEDHCRAIDAVLARGRTGQTYNVGGWNEKTNLEVVNSICAALDSARPRPEGPHQELIRFVADRPGHDRRYAIDATRIERELDWRPQETFDSGLRSTVRWYLDHMDWVNEVASGAYQKWIDEHYGERRTA
jgi:dTDP-glucose 4,6-dehydratase